MIGLRDDVTCEWDCDWFKWRRHINVSGIVIGLRGDVTCERDRD